MKNRWSQRTAAGFVSKYGKMWGDDVALRTYTSRLIGEEPELVLHGGGNTSVKATFRNILGRQCPAIFVKASGYDLRLTEPEGHPALDLEYLKQLRELETCSDQVMANELRTHLFQADAPMPSIETLLHAFLPPKFIDHTHADSVLALSNRPDGEKRVRDALGDDVIILEYVRPGFPVARAAAEAFEEKAHSIGMVLMKHGLVTWGDTARESYDRTIKLVTEAERYLVRMKTKPVRTAKATPSGTARKRYRFVAPILRGALAQRTEDPDRPYRRFVLKPVCSADMLSLLSSPRGKRIVLSPPLTSDHLIRTKPFPLWVDKPDYDDEAKLKRQLSRAVAAYEDRYHAYVNRHIDEFESAVEPADPVPRVIALPGLGVVCAGRDVVEAEVVRDITVQTLKVKTQIAASGAYGGLTEEQLFDMEYMSLQQAKLGDRDELPLERCVAVVTGAAGAIGSGICEELLKHGCHVAATDLARSGLRSLVTELSQTHGDRVIGVPLDVTDARSVTEGFRQIIETWGGVDLLVANAGLALVSSLEGMDARAFQKVQQVNVDGTLGVLSEAARHFRRQGTGGDVVLISTKNVFSPGAQFGAYSATKAAAHQLARVASLELAEAGVRVNAVSPDAVFEHHGRRSGLWAEVGPDRMRARGLDEKGLEEYYRNRNLLKSAVTATHVARAVLFFATRQTPTTGATIPVDGGLPDATPR